MSTGTVKRQYILRMRTSRSMACIGMPPSGASLSAYQCPGIRVRQPERFRHGGIDHLPLDHVQAQEQRCVVAARLLPAVARQPLRVGERSRSGARSSSVTCPPRPAAILAALAPPTPPPRMSTAAGSTPGTPPNRMPEPPYTFSKYLAPSCTAIHSATSLIGVSSGSSPELSCTVSYAIAVIPEVSTALVSGSDAAK